MDNFTAIPPDTTGAISPQHVVTMLNTQVQIQSRAGVVRPNYPISLKAFWSPISSSDPFDPRIQYDPASDRWIACAAVAAETTSSALLVAVSQTGDPGAGWNYFKVNVGPSDWIDYPILGFNGTWVVVTVNLFRVTNGNYHGTSLYVFNKSDLFRDGTGGHTTFTDFNGEMIPATDFDNHPDVLYFLQTSAGLTPSVRISKLQGQPGNESFTGGNVGVIPLDETFADIGPDGEDFAPQAGSAVKIDTGDSRLQNCLLRGGHIWCAHTIFLPATAPTRSSVQWMELDLAGLRVVQRGRIDDPTSNYFYAYPSIAVNRNGDAMVGFTRFGAADYASAEFAFRLASDPPGALEPEVMFKRGEAVYATPGPHTGSNRWGDYSMTLVDPIDDLTFWTVQEYASTPPAGQRGQFGTWWAKVTAPSTGLRCTYTLSATSQLFPGLAADGTIEVATAAGCPWMAASNTAWIQITSGNPGSGAGSVAYSIGINNNSSVSRTGTLTIAGQTVTITQAAPAVGVDLAVTAMSAPTSAEPGQQVTVSATVLNQSNAAAGPFRIGVYLGIGPSVGPRDTLLASCTVTGLAAAGSTNCSRTIALPATIQPGRYAIGAVADDQQQIPDPTTSNNTRLSDFGTIAITPTVVRPAIPAQGIVNAASYLGGAVAPGELVTLFGSNLGPRSAQFPSVSAQGIVDTIAGGARVLFDGTPAPMVYALTGQVSVVVPFSVQGRSSTQVQAEYLGLRSDPVTIVVAAAAPAIFTLDKSGRGGGAILNQNLTVNSSDNPATRGSTIVIYATGGGAFPGAIDGRLAQPPLQQLRQLSVRIGGAIAQTTYAGEAPGIIEGALQINATVPPTVSPGAAVPIEIAIGNATSQAGVTVAIR